MTEIQRDALRVQFWNYINTTHCLDCNNSCSCQVSSLFSEKGLNMTRDNDLKKLYSRKSIIRIYQNQNFPDQPWNLERHYKFSKIRNKIVFTNSRTVLKSQFMLIVFHRSAFVFTIYKIRKMIPNIAWISGAEDPIFLTPNFYCARADRIFLAALSPREFRRATKVGSQIVQIASLSMKFEKYVFFWRLYFFNV